MDEEVAKHLNIASCLMKFVGKRELAGTIRRVRDEKEDECFDWPSRRILL